MSKHTTIVLSILMVGFSLALSLFVFDSLPEPMASHWNVANQVDGYMPRFWGAFLMPLVTIGMVALLMVVPLIDPLKANIAKFQEYFYAFIAVMVVFLAYMHVVTVLWNLGYNQFNMGTAVLPGIGLIFVFAGIMMRKAKRNYFVGIRTPWTLSSDWVWEQTHRVGSVLFILSGLLSLLGAFFPDTAMWFVFVPVLGVTLFLVVYSYVLYQRETRA
jgi:uncharacterized membrane protein